MTEKHKVNWILTGIVLLMYFGLMGYLIYYAETIGKHPCTLCAEKTGENVMCYTPTGDYIKFFPNGSLDSSFTNSKNRNFPS